MKPAGLFVALLTLSGGLLGTPVPSALAAGAPSPAPENHQGTIVAMGDSLTAGLRVPESEAYPAQLERKLHEAGYKWKVVNAGISGETSSGALARTNWVLKLKPDIVILETGANDGMRGIDPKITRANIDQTVSALKSKGVIVVLVGMRMFSNLGPTFTKAFAEIYPSIAARHHLILMPFFLSGVAGDPSLNQPDGIHPVAKGYRIVSDRIYPYLVKAIDLKKKQTKR